MKKSSSAIAIEFICYLFVGFLLGSLTAFAVSVVSQRDSSIEQVIRAGNVGLAASILVWLVCSNRASSNRRARKQCRPEQRPVAFSARLAQFVGKDADELRASPQTYQSRMKFWMLTHVTTPFAPKPSWLIRQLLERIRAGAKADH